MPSVRSLAWTLGGIAAATGAGRVAQGIFSVEEQPPATDGHVDSAGAAASTAAFVRSGGGPDEVGWPFATSRAASIQPFAEGREFYPRLLDDLAAATSSIHILMFGWKPGAVGSAVASLLLERLAAGVEVRVLVDSFGSRPYGSSKEMYTELADAGAEIVVNDLLPPDRRGRYPDAVPRWPMSTVARSDHRKLYVLDGQTMWTGGAGIEDHFENGEFHDVMVRLEGDVVRQAQAAFLASFSAQGGSVPDELGDLFPEPAQRGEIECRIGQVVPGGHVSATHAARELIDGATERLDVMNPYLTDADVISRIAAAARRGVRVRTVVSERSNNFLATAALKHHYPLLIDAGVEIWEYPGAVVHAKVLVADDRVQFGTLNLDAWALYRNFEFAVVARSPDVVEGFDRALFEPDIARSRAGRPPSGSRTRVTSALASRLAFAL